MRQRRGAGRGRTGARLAVVVAWVGLAVVAAACSLKGLDGDYTGEPLDSPDASVSGDATGAHADAADAADAGVGDALLLPSDAALDGAAADGDARQPDGDASEGKVVCPHIDSGLHVCDDSPAHATATVHCADAGSPTSPDFYACGTTADCMSGSLCVDEGFCKPTCATSIECADDPVAVQYGATSCNPVMMMK